MFESGFVGNPEETFCRVELVIRKPGPGVIKLFSCSTQLSTKFQLLINTKYRQIMKFLAFKSPRLAG